MILFWCTNVMGLYEILFIHCCTLQEPGLISVLIFSSPQKFMMLIQCQFASMMENYVLRLTYALNLILMFFANLTVSHIFLPLWQLQKYVYCSKFRTLLKLKKHLFAQKLCMYHCLVRLDMIYGLLYMTQNGSMHSTGC